MQRDLQLPSPIQAGIKLLTFQENLSLVGSITYKEHLYPADIDAREDIIVCCSVDDAIKKVYAELVKKIKYISSNFPDILFSDFKAGMYFNADGEEVPIRWLPEDIIRGYVFISKYGQAGETKVTLLDALQEDSIVKFDIYVWYQGRYIEMSNFMFIFMESGSGKPILINGEQADYLTALLADMQFYYNEGKVFKALKRLWTYSVATNDQKMIELINPLLSSRWAYLYQILADIEAIQDINKKIINKGLNFVRKFTLNYATAQKYNELISRRQQLKEMLLDRASYFITDYKGETIMDLQAYLTDILNTESKKFLKDSGIKVFK